MNEWLLAALLVGAHSPPFSLWFFACSFLLRHERVASRCFASRRSLRVFTAVFRLVFFCDMSEWLLAALLVGSLSLRPFHCGLSPAVPFCDMSEWLLAVLLVGALSLRPFHYGFSPHSPFSKRPSAAALSGELRSARQIAFQPPVRCLRIPWNAFPQLLFCASYTGFCFSQHFVHFFSCEYHPLLSSVVALHYYYKLNFDTLKLPFIPSPLYFRLSVIGSIRDVLIASISSKLLTSTP